MNVLITGGAGFIGSHLAERCLAEGWRVAALDDLSTGAFENIAHLKAKSDFSYEIDTVFNEPLVAEMVDSADVVFHLAAAVGVKLVVEHPVRTIETNVHGAEVVLRCAAKKSKPVILASTSEVYGKSTRLPFSEGDDLVSGPSSKSRWSYAGSKLLDEFLGIAYWRERQLPVAIVRLFNTVGPRQTGRYGMVLPTFARQALGGEPLTVHSDGQQRRCFSYVGDVAEALVRIVQTPEAVGEVINIGNDRETTINELAALVKELAGSSSRVDHIPYDLAYGPGFEDMSRRVPCLRKLESLIHYRPTTPLESIVRRVLDYEWVKISKKTIAAKA